MAIALWATGVLDLTKALAGFGDPTVLFIAALFVVAEALDASGVTAWAGQQLLAGAGESRTRVMVFMLLLVALVTALITVNASVAALMPVVVVMAVRLRWPPSQLLMPLAFGAHAGSLLALTGTPVNVIISDAAADAGVGAIGFVEFAYVGLPLVIGTIADHRPVRRAAAADAERDVDVPRLQRPRRHADGAVRRRVRAGRAADSHVGRGRGRDSPAVGPDRRRRPFRGW